MAFAPIAAVIFTGSNEIGDKGNLLTKINKQKVWSFEGKSIYLHLGRCILRINVHLPRCIYYKNSIAGLADTDAEQQ